MNQKSNKVNHFWPAGRKNVIQSDVPVSKAAWHVRRAEEFARSIKGKVDLSLVKEMARAGCKEVSLGFESGSNRVLQTMNKRFTTEDIRRASRMLADHGIGQMGFLLLGSPNETKETVEESLSFVDSLPLNALKFTVGIRIYPDTDLARTAVNEGVISSEDILLHPTFYMAKSIELFANAIAP